MNEISEHDNISFSYISSRENPAEIASRGTF